MKKDKFSPFTFLRKGLCTLLALWVLLAAPTGWLYDLWAGEGTGQGQRPGDRVRLIRRQEDVEAFFWSGSPVTVTAGELVACPLARLRDIREEGVHYKSGPGRRGVYLSEYITAGYPLSTWEKAIQSFAGGSYNRYYLVELGDGTRLCVYFDDYLRWKKDGGYPAGYVRYTTTEERRMLREMAEDYGVDPVYVLDMYRHGKVSWIVDMLLRFGFLLAAALIFMTFQERWGKRKEKDG